MILDASAVLAYLQQEQGCVEVDSVHDKKITR